MLFRSELVLIGLEFYQRNYFYRLLYCNAGFDGKLIPEVNVISIVKLSV